MDNRTAEILALQKRYNSWNEDSDDKQTEDSAMAICSFIGFKLRDEYDIEQGVAQTAINDMLTRIVKDPRVLIILHRWATKKHEEKKKGGYRNVPH